jgi:hypothetical protein
VTRTPRRRASFGDRHQHHRHREDREARLEWRVAEHELEVLKGDEEKAELREELQRQGERADAEAAPGEQTRVEHRLAARQLEQDERDQERGPNPEAHDRHRVDPAPLRCLDHRIHEPEQAEGGQERADRVESHAVRAP